jgi:hypothetical protein
MVMNEDLGPSLDLPQMLEVLDRHAVDLVVIGGVAGLAHGSSYPTFDLDVAYGRDRRNLERLAAALVELEVTLRNAPADLPFQIDADSLEAGGNFTFDSKFGRFDILCQIGGVRDYQWLRAGAEISDISGVPVLVASLDQMIGMKRAVNRTKDQLMVEEYIVIADLRQRMKTKEND